MVQNLFPVQIETHFKKAQCNGKRLMNSLPFIHQKLDGTVLDIYVQPKAARNELVGMHQGSLKVRLTAPPVEGEANKECIKFLAKLLNVSKSDLEIIQGHKSRQKSILIRGISSEVLESILHEKGVVQGTAAGKV